jgi:hypothetical protein
MTILDIFISPLFCDSIPVGFVRSTVPAKEVRRMLQRISSAEQFAVALCVIVAIIIALSYFSAPFGWLWRQFW